MKIIDRYILNEIKIPIIFGISLFTFIFLIDIIVAMMENIIIKGISIFDVLRILSFYLPPILAQTIPMGMFLGIMITFSKFTRTSESTAMSAIGMSLKDIVKPIFITSIFITIFIFFLQESIIPRSITKLEYLTKKIAYENPVFQLKEKTFLNDMNDYSIYINKIKDGKAKGILIFEKTNDKIFPTVIISKKAFWQDSAMVLTDSNFYNFDKNGVLSLKGSFEEKKIPLGAYFSTMKLRVKEIEGLGIVELYKKMKKMNGKAKIPYEIEINKKLSLPLATIMLSVLGILLSIGHHRSGKGANFALSLIVIFAYITCLNIGLVMASRGNMPIFLAIWTPDIILFIVTALMYKYKARVI